MVPGQFADRSGRARRSAVCSRSSPPKKKLEVVETLRFFLWSENRVSGAFGWSSIRYKIRCGMFDTNSFVDFLEKEQSTFRVLLLFRVKI